LVDGPQVAELQDAYALCALLTTVGITDKFKTALAMEFAINRRGLVH